MNTIINHCTMAVTMSERHKEIMLSRMHTHTCRMQNLHVYFNYGGLQKHIKIVGRYVL